MRLKIIESKSTNRWEDLETSKQELIIAIATMVNSSEGIGDEEKLKLLDLALEFEDICCISLMTRKAAKVTLSVLRLKTGAIPKRSKLRKYPDEQLKFMNSFVKELEQAGCISKS
jgi:hypothetical protein